MLLDAGDISLEVQKFGAMITGGSFRLPNGVIARPFFRNRWREDPDTKAVDPIIRHLGAEWPCVPFGMPEMPDNLPRDWQIAQGPDWNAFIHGFGSNREWELCSTSASSLRARIEYPEPAPVRQLERSIALDPELLSVNLRLKIEMRSAARIAVGLHPVFDLVGCTQRSCTLSVSGSSESWSYPVDVEPGRSRFLPDQRGVSMESVLDRSGTPMDGSRVPLDSATEDLLLLTDPGGEVVLSVPERGYKVAVRWDPEDLPSCSLWYSNGGREFSPWNGKVRAIGIEPTAASFDLGQAASLSKETPLAKSGVLTNVAASPEAPFETEYSIAVSPHSDA